MVDDPLVAALAKIRERAAEHADPKIMDAYRGWCASKSADDVPSLLAAVDAALKLHGAEPWYCAASDCEHPEPAEDSDEHDDWYDDHTSGTGGIVVCLLTQIDSFCPECTRLRYDTLEPEGDDFVSAPCVTRSAILAALTGKAA